MVRTTRKVDHTDRGERSMPASSGFANEIEIGSRRLLCGAICLRRKYPQATMYMVREVQQQGR